MAKKVLITLLTAAFLSAVVLAEPQQKGPADRPVKKMQKQNDQLLEKLKDAYQQNDMEQVGKIINSLERRKGRMQQDNRPQPPMKPDGKGKNFGQQRGQGQGFAGPMRGQMGQGQCQMQGRNPQGPRAPMQRQGQGRLQQRGFAGPMRGQMGQGRCQMQGRNPQGPRAPMQRQGQGRKPQRGFAGPMRRPMGQGRGRWQPRGYDDDQGQGRGQQRGFAGPMRRPMQQCQCQMQDRNPQGPRAPMQRQGWERGQQRGYDDDQGQGRMNWAGAQRQPRRQGQYWQDDKPMKGYRQRNEWDW